MTDRNASDGDSAATDPRAQQSGGGGIVDLIPLILFFAVYAVTGLMEATAAAMIATVAVVVYAYRRHGSVPQMALLSGGLLLVFGGLTLWLDDETFIKMKPTIVLALFAFAALGGRAVGWSLSKTLIGTQMPTVPDPVWRRIDLRFSIFYLSLGGANEAVWRLMSTDAWVAFKVFGITVASIVFVFAQWPTLKRAEDAAAEEA